MTTLIFLFPKLDFKNDLASDESILHLLQANKNRVKSIKSEVVTTYQNKVKSYLDMELMNDFKSSRRAWSV
ncbi:hypothetical protein CS022_23695 [Veronia nyctiphanis]|uniref:Uncharacterized protein n=1 Tax=Veronia nyctiphanis TaxID=1278244 RepID=A0A4Q0YFY9_9GAMM|nr:hypothetical protein CS022_23695 [Veronia nyctiphanis]